MVDNWNNYSNQAKTIQELKTAINTKKRIHLKISQINLLKKEIKTFQQKSK